MFWRMTAAALVSYPVALAVVRLIGKKQVSSMTYWDLVSGIALGSLIANVVTNQQTPITYAIWAVGLWGALTLLTDWTALQGRFFGRVLQGAPTVVIANGKVMEQALRSERMTMDLLLSELRVKGVSNVSEVEFAVLEPTGKLSVLKKSQSLPVTPADLDLKTAYKGLSTAVVLEGRVQEENLHRVGLTRDWLTNALATQGISDLSAVFYAELGTDGTLYIDRKQDNPDRRWQQH